MIALKTVISFFGNCDRENGSHHSSTGTGAHAKTMQEVTQALSCLV